MRELYKNLRPEEIQYNNIGLQVRGDVIASDNPRLSFLLALQEFSDIFTKENIIHDSVRMGVGVVIGGDGFGYEQMGGRLIKMPHLGNVVIEKDVVIHNNTCIDRAVLGSTIIGEGTKIDNLVHIAHGAKIGNHCLIVAGTVVGGSVIIGDNTFIGMNVCIRNSVDIGSDCFIGAGAVVVCDVPDGETWYGNPAKKR